MIDPAKMMKQFDELDRRLTLTREEVHRYAVEGRRMAMLLSAALDQKSYQERVKPWLHECFGEKVATDKTERADRLLEEVLELLQSGGYDQHRVAQLVNYVWSRPAGAPAQEAGGVMVTMAAYCLAHGLDMHLAGEHELRRINEPELLVKIREKQKGKAAKLGFSPLPAAAPDSEFGYCPTCQAPVTAVSRQPDGDSVCAAGHTFKTSATLTERKEERL